MENKELNLQLTQYQPVLKNLAYKFTSDPDEVKDLVQETILRSLKYVDQFFHNPKIISWLFVIMKNIYINQYRSKQQKVVFENHKLASYRNDGCIEPSTTNSVESQLALQDILKTLDDLPATHCEIFLDFVNGYKYREIADIYGIPEGTVKSRIHFIRKNLQKKHKL